MIARTASLLKLAPALFAFGLALAAVVAPGQAQAGAIVTASRFCDRTQPLSATEQDRLLRFAAVVREELAATDGNAADVTLISRSGLDLSRFGIRYSHAALAWRQDDGLWSARQLYYACDERRPRIFDQGTAGFVMGTDDAALGYISMVRMPAEAAPALRQALLDQPRVLHLLAGTYSANAYAYSLRYQNCNQWVIELLAAAWGGLDDGDDLRARAQDWLRGARYEPEPVAVGARWRMWAAYFVPLLHLDDHPQSDRDALALKVSLPSTLEAFVRQRMPASDRVEICHDDKQVVVHHGWDPIADGCKPGAGDRVLPFD